MSSRKKRKKNSNRLFVLLCLISSIFFIYHILLLGPIEKEIRYLLIFIILLVDFICYCMPKKKKSTQIILLILIFIHIIGGYSINKAYGIIDSIHKDKVVYSTSLITLKNNPIQTIKEVTNQKIGMIDDNLSIDNYVIAKEMIEDEKLESSNEIISYPDPLKMLNDLYQGNINLMFISSNYQVMFQDIEGFENIVQEVKVIKAKDKIIKKKSQTAISFTNTNIKKPFSILLMGIDSEKDGLKKNGYANGDSLILLTLNPDTLNVTMMSIPRDSYVPISCRNNEKNKLTHAGWYGVDCMIHSIENVFDIQIDYYVKINFKGVVGIVNALGGVNVNVAKKLCTDDSNRQNIICIEPGMQTLNGEEALVLARNRYDLKLGDIDRGYNQQLLIRAMINKMTEVRNINQILNLLETISNNLDTNLSTDEILSFYNIFKDILLSRNYQKSDDFINIIQIKLAGENKKIYFKNVNQNLWIYDLKKESIQQASLEMKTNLEVEKANMIKSFQFMP